MAGGSPIGLRLAQEAVTDVCGTPEEARWLCDLVYSLTGREALARAADVIIARPVAVLLIVLGAWFVNRLARRGIRRLVKRLKEDIPTTRLLAVEGQPTLTRRVQRAEGIGTLLRSTSTVVIWTVAGLMVLGELGFNLAPLLAGAGVVGVALGFGSQTLVRDFLSGAFMLIEDQYGVGDIIDTGEATGIVESISLRTTRVRSVDGVLWHVPNGEIRRVGNMSQEWSRALLDVPVAYGSDLKEVAGIIAGVAERLAAEPEWAERILDTPEVWGVESFDADSIAIRLVVKTQPLQQWRVSRELRRRIKEAFDEAGVEIPFPQRTVWLRQDHALDSNPAGGNPEDDAPPVTPPPAPPSPTTPPPPGPDGR